MSRRLLRTLSAPPVPRASSDARAHVREALAEVVPAAAHRPRVRDPRAPRARHDAQGHRAEFGISINTVANLAANAHKKLGAHSAAAGVLAHRDAHPWCGSRIDFGPVLERIKASRTA